MKALLVLLLLSTAAYATATCPASPLVRCYSRGMIDNASVPLAYTVDIVTQDVFVEVLPNTNLMASSLCFDQSANGRLRYTCGDAATFGCFATITVDAPGQRTARMRLGDNGATTIGSEARDSGNTHTTTIFEMIDLTQNEYVSVFVANASDTTDFTVDTLNIMCMEAL